VSAHACHGTGGHAARGSINPRSGHLTKFSPSRIILGAIHAVVRVRGTIRCAREGAPGNEIVAGTRSEQAARPSDRRHYQVLFADRLAPSRNGAGSAKNTTSDTRALRSLLGAAILESRDQTPLDVKKCS